MNRRLPHNSFLCFSIASVIRLRSFDTPFPRTSPSHTGNTSRLLYSRDFNFPAPTLPWVGITQCQSPARFLSCDVYRTSARAIYLGNTLRVLHTRDSTLSAWILPWIWICAVPIACPISQLRRVHHLFYHH